MGTWFLLSLLMRLEAEHRAEMMELSNLNRLALTTQLQQSSRTLSEHLSLTDKAMALVKSGDPLAFQSIQAMAATPSGYDSFQSFDPSDEGENERIGARTPGLVEDVSGREEAFFGDVGIDPDFLPDFGNSN